MSEKADAWILKINDLHSIAVGINTFKEFLLNPVMHTTPLAPQHCQHITIWQGHVIPVVNFNQYPKIRIQENDNSNSVGIFAYQKNTGEPLMYGGISLPEQPERIQVNNDMACLLDDEFLTWKQWSISSFSIEDKTIPILDLSLVYSRQAPNITSAIAA